MDTAWKNPEIVLQKNTDFFKNTVFECVILHAMIIAQRIKELRTENHLTQAQLAKMVGCSQPMIVLWEKEVCEPTASAIVRLAEALGCSCDYLLGFDGY
mgnify:CR=1 FL=1